MDQNTNFKVGDIVHIVWSGGRPSSFKRQTNPNARQVMSVKILKITPKRFLVQQLYTHYETDTDSSDEEGEARRPAAPFQGYVKNVYAID